MRAGRGLVAGLVLVGGLGLGGCAVVVAGVALVPAAFGGAGTGGAGPGGQGGNGAGGQGGNGAGGSGTGTGGHGPVRRARGAAVSPGLASTARAASATCPGLSWALLAALAWVRGDRGPSSLTSHATVAPGGSRPATPIDPVDVLHTAAAVLCAAGAGTPSDRYGALRAYGRSRAVAESVLVLARSLAIDPGLGNAPATALTFAAAHLGVPYRWGGTGPGGFDCSGLVQAAYRSAGIDLPRVAQDQFDAGPPVPAGSAPRPGDLVFFGSSPAGVGHVGIYVGGGEMIDAPHTGAVVRVEATPTVVGRAWGGDRYVGATRPGG